LKQGTLLQGVGCALAAGLVWGLVFIAPVLLPDYPAAVLSVGRYLAFGLIALPLALADRAALARLERTDWAAAAWLSLVGNLVYYGFLAAAIQMAGAPLPTMIIGALPVVIAVYSNLAQRELEWRRLALPLAVLATGIALVNHDELGHLSRQGGSARQLLLGALLAAVAVACWTWYPVCNARWLKRNPHIGSGTWATAQGLTTLPLACTGALLLTLAGWLGPSDSMLVGFNAPLGPDPLRFVALMFAIGLTASWLGTLFWNRASQLLPTSLAGQLIVFETLSALLYAFLLRGSWPGAATLAGVALLVAGVVLGIRAAQPPRPPALT
jgi:drug/metabolite transporter (DMT)-like permease